MPSVNVFDGRSSIPIIYVKGTHYQVGYEVGRTFASLIQSYVEKHSDLNKCLLPWYKKVEGKAVYDETLAAMKKSYPQYVAELEGTADGAKVDFHKLFLLHVDDILPGAIGQQATDVGQGCSSVMCKLPGKELLGHNEDALNETLGHFYFVSAHIISDEPQGKWGTKEERFTSLCYAGNLPGFTMSYNHHGLVYSVNIIGVKHPRSGKTPRTFLTRALLAAENIKQAEQIIRDSGVGIGNGVSINMVFVNGNQTSFYNAEAGPVSDGVDESAVDIVPVKGGDFLYHCNRYLRLDVEENQLRLMESSVHRHKSMDSLPVPKCEKGILCILGDESDTSFPLFRSGKTEFVATIATGIFNFTDMTWSIYTRNPKETEPIMVLPMDIKKQR
ncbi:UNVERIFIED_CONTAM: hypothetical protein PYX00_001699 [Menopon gallinae]|uniref:Peptidase C45 hydrolase domain-containing protein n=1 Tax=Menopon gallinae TaxID=328185 RepID=A0AAW2IDQ8_9NEOP